MPKRLPWTPEELEDLRRLCEKRKNHRLDWKKILKRFPDRSVHAINKRMHLHGMCKPRSWTPREDETLLLNWNDSALASLKKYLPGRTKDGIYGRARKLGLSAGTPQGMISLKSLSEDPAWGYDYYKTLRILQTAGIVVRRFGYTGNKSGVRYVERDEARRAAVGWERKIAEERVGKETPKEAAARLHVRPSTFRDWLTLEGMLPPKSRKNKRLFWAVPEVFDRVYAKYGANRPTRTESP
jgi:hypothetical protein